MSESVEFVSMASVRACVCVCARACVWYVQHECNGEMNARHHMDGLDNERSAHARAHEHAYHGTRVCERACVRACFRTDIDRELVLDGR